MKFDLFLVSIMFIVIGHIAVNHEWNAKNQGKKDKGGVSMAEISRADAIICYMDMNCERCSLKDAGIDRCCKLAEKKAISDMEKLEKIEKLIDDCTAYPDDMCECLVEIEKIVKGE